ncbi:FKBP-type peptidyl-prolyl cis-trans isomerase [Isoptericola sp. b441]|uniref:Peptidyl-prolyl cis-trans isomerase n=1 Tax=Actinotalea lenta TaxID=3064654 RepID=A0ABT9D9H7_9CELL|nr:MULTISPECIES: FKBP-type peptidyl-prolyl cis-trans isomerase [unclassified Isoptericola]MDO8107564.1 FKBP-type peptidyl-prolyl cis-trans isomerase [Isoptericola sp. b441]MDO8120776.1 FKBP-type peptidyl-prolyl cis-trans isomerase [Isoptericola sp. b490]
MRRRLTAALAAVVIVGGLASGCSAPGNPTPSVEVAGEPGKAPELHFTTPLDVPRQRVRVLAPGDGPELADGHPVLLDFYAESAQDGSVIAETYSGEPRAYTMSPDSLGPDLYNALHGRHVGARILQEAPGREGYPATVAVYDILPTRASGETVSPRRGLPTVTRGPNGKPTVSVPDADPPTDVVAQPLIRGDGPQVEPGQVITVQYVGVTWSDGKVFDSTWADGKLPADFPIGVGSLPKGWDEGLLEQTVGSQVLLVLPPGAGFAGTEKDLSDQTVVFVVDILAARGGIEGGTS